MSDKWIPYGPGCDIDPTGMEEHITYKEEVLSPDRELLRLLWNALQQGEERKKKAVAILHKELLSIESGHGGRGSASAMIDAIAELEGTDEE